MLTMFAEHYPRFNELPFAELSKHETPFTDQIAGRKITVHFDSESQTGRVVDAKGTEVPSVIAFGFSWVAFYPDTTVFQASD